jgi:tRNA dimethylallyltransferase
MDKTDKIPIIVICGPTASGKSSLGLDVARKFNGEIISADSMQLYKYMDIGTAKATKAEQEEIPHHMIDVLEPSEDNNVKKYCTMAKKCIAEIFGKGCIPILAGGTGLYINSLIDNIKFADMKNDTAYRQKLNDLAYEKGNRYLHDILKKTDPQSADKLPANDLTRIIRALEVYHLTGITKTELDKRSREIESPYKPIMIGLSYKNRDKLYERINHRVDIMMDQGLLNEVKMLLNMGIDKKSTSMAAIGYKELVSFLEGEITKQEAVELIKQQSRRYAKRQLTWFRKDKRINWIFCDECDDTFSLACDIITASGYYN